MIESTTDLLEEVLHEIQQLKFFDPIFQDSIAKKESLAEQKREYAVRSACLQGHFLRIAYTDKVKLLVDLLAEVKSANGIGILLNSVTLASGKMGDYMKTMAGSNYVYDKTFTSHSRALRGRALGEMLEDDVAWFSTLAEVQKIALLIGLVRMSGGAAILRLRERLLPLLRARLASQSDTNLKYCTSYTLRDMDGWRLDEKLNDLAKGEYEEPQFDPKDPLTIEVEKLRNQWKKKIAAYKAKVTVAEKKEQVENEKKGKKGEEDGSKKIKDTKKDKKKNKEGKDGKEQGVVDRIQLLPAWIVKKIFSYLDKKTLNKAKTVNEYWKYVITDYLKEVATRKKLDKEIEKIEGSFTHDREKYKPCPKSTVKHKVVGRQKRLLRLINEGCCNKKLRIRPVNPHTKSLISSAPKLLENEYVLPVANLESFPRSSCSSYKLHRPPSFVCIDGGYIRAVKANEDGKNYYYHGFDGENT